VKWVSFSIGSSYHDGRSETTSVCHFSNWHKGVHRRAQAMT
jgi:hypothetical protein